MAFASGGYHGMYFYPEASFGVTPLSPGVDTAGWIPFRHTSMGAPLKRDKFESKELRGDRAITDVRLGVHKVAFDVGFELSYGAFDSILEALLGGTWAVAYALASQTIAIDATAHTLVRGSGSFITDGVQVGDPFVMAGSTTAGNNGTYIIDTVGALSLHWASTTAATPTTEAGSGAQTATTTRFKVNQGLVQRSFSILRRHADITQYKCIAGCSPNKITFDLKPEGGMVVGTFGFIGREVTAELPAGSTYAAASAYPPMDCFGASVFEGGVEFAKASAINFSLENGIEACHVVGSKFAAQLTWGRSKAEGKLSAFYEDLAMYNKYLNETPSSLKFTTGDGTRNLVWYMDNVHYTSADDPVKDEKPIQIDMGFDALHDTVYTNLQIDRNPGA